jgi:hypothetical protein
MIDSEFPHRKWYLGTCTCTGSSSQYHLVYMIVIAIPRAKKPRRAAAPCLVCSQRATLPTATWITKVREPQASPYSAASVRQSCALTCLAVCRASQSTASWAPDRVVEMLKSWACACQPPAGRWVAAVTVRGQQHSFIVTLFLAAHLLVQLAIGLLLGVPLRLALRHCGGAVWVMHWNVQHVLAAAGARIHLRHDRALHLNDGRQCLRELQDVG